MTLTFGEEGMCKQMVIVETFRGVLKLESMSNFTNVLGSPVGNEKT